MASWYKNILTNTTSQLSSLQSRLLQTENDGDTEDDTHVCRVLRAYYTQEQRPLPGWLPPDPKAPPPVAPVYASTQPQVGARYGAAASGGGGQLGGVPASGSLSSLWDRNPAQQAQGAPQSLRQGRGGGGQLAQQQRVSPFAQGGGGGGDDRPGTEGRAGSYQSGSVYSQGSTSAPAPAAAGGGSAQDRLKQRLWGGGARTTSPAGSQGPYQPPSSGGGSHGGDYEERFAPGGQYDGRGGGDRSYTGSSTSWSNNEPAYGGGGGGRPAQGLPSGPRRQGLPSGPRMR
ncbi:hypothetical protein VD0001_g2842 [Verticillium dahliae]|nr:hypothetical protein VD0001_g2842 [Verticillium dahliae]